MSYNLSEPGLPGILKKLGAMTSIRDTYLVEQSLLRTLGPLLGVKETSLYRVDEHGAVIRALHYSRSEQQESNGALRFTEHIEETDSEHNLDQEVRELLEDVRLFEKTCSKKVAGEVLICYPLHGGNAIRGYFVFRRELENSLFDDAIVRGVLEVFTNYYDLLDTSQRDQLSGLLNRYSLESNLDRIWNLLSARIEESEAQGTRRESAPQTYWLAIFDIDHFKKVNDTYGHIIGDEVLIMVARLLQNSFRQSDLLYRFGGEEFVAIIAANDLASAQQTFERARLKVEQFAFPQVGHVTISGGFSEADPSVLPQEVIHRADSTLYAAKNAGRNRVYHYGTLVKEGVLKSIEAGSIDLF